MIYASVAALYAVATSGVLRDDAYIFFTYARHLAETGTLAFNPGEPSYGVTSILWTLLLAAGTALAHDPVAVAKVLGVMLGAAGAMLWGKWIHSGTRRSVSLSAIAIAALWPTIGADRMVTGMESGLQCTLSGALVFSTTLKCRGRHFIIGGLSGLLILTRPELLIALFALVMFVAIRENLFGAVKVLVAALAISAWWPFWLYNHTGSFLPPTRVGKLSVFLPEQLSITFAEFESGSVWQHIGWGWEAIKHFTVSGVSSVVFILLLALAVGTAIRVLSARPTWPVWRLILPPAATIFLMILYGLTFPLLQLRYFVWLVPALVFGLHASLALRVRVRTMRIAETGLVIACLALLPAVLTRRIESTKVQHLRRQVADAVGRLTPLNSRIALEPIGEVGFYSHRYVVDMGGITDTRIQPYLRHGYDDVGTIWRCMVDQQADYLVTYDHDRSLGRLPETYPQRFEHMLFVPEEPFRGVRYRLLRVVHDHSNR